MRVIAVVNQKGGVGKTTACVNLGHALASKGSRVTLIDLDPQGQLSACLGHHAKSQPGIDQVLLHEAALADQLVATRHNLSFVPAGSALDQFEHLCGGAERTHVLRDALENLQRDADVLLLDCASSTGILAVNAVFAATDVLMPVAGDYLSLTSLVRLMLMLKRLTPLHGHSPRQWVFFSRFTPRRRLSQEVYAKVATHFPESLLRTSVTEAAALAECAGAGKTIFEFRGSSRSAREFNALADDLLQARVVHNEQETTSDVA